MPAPCVLVVTGQSVHAPTKVLLLRTRSPGPVPDLQATD